MTLEAEYTQVIQESGPDGSVVLRISGELDVQSRNSIEPPVLVAIASAESVIIDLAELTFCDSHGIGLFIAAGEKARAEGTALVVRHLRPPIRRIFALTGLDTVIDLHD